MYKTSNLRRLGAFNVGVDWAQRGALLIMAGVTFFPVLTPVQHTIKTSWWF